MGRTLLDRAADLQALKRVPHAWAAVVHHRTHRDRPLDFERVPAIFGLYTAQSQDLAIKKATQTYATEYLLCRAIMSCIRGLSVFYVLPTLQLVSRVVHNRLDRTLDYTPYYRRYRQAEATSLPGNVTYKQIGAGAMAFVGSNSRAGFTEFPADVAIVDELDECDQENLTMAWERLGASEEREQVWSGNPTIPDSGIAAKFKASDGRRWFVKAACGHRVNPDFFRHVVRHEGANNYRVIDRDFDLEGERDCRLICDRCGKPFDPKGDGEWVAERPAERMIGFHFDKLMAGNVLVRELLGRFAEGLIKPAVLQRFWNGDLGLEYMAPGANIGPEMLDACRGEHVAGRPAVAGLYLLGLDVQAGYFVAVVGRVDLRRERLTVVQAAEIPSPEGSLRPLMEFMRDYRILAGVVDAQPERRIAQMICKRFRGMFRCFWGEGRRDTVVAKVLSVNRTAAIDQVRDACQAPEGGGRPYLELPANARELPGFYEQVGAAVRVYDAEANRGRGDWVWKSGDKPDHYCMALAYLLLARNMALRVMERRQGTLPGAVKTTTVSKGGDPHADGDH